MPKRTTLRILLPCGVSFAIAVAILWLLARHYTTGKTDFNSVDKMPSGFVVNTTGCRIPDFDAFDPSIRNFIFPEEKTRCKVTYGTALVESNATTLFINESALPFYKITDISDLRCCYTSFWRVELNKLEKYPEDVDSQVRFAETCIQFTDSIVVADEFVEVKCYLSSFTSEKLIYTDFHVFTPNKTTTKRKTFDHRNENSLSVIILGVDSVSRLHLHRQMPLTVNFLKKSLNAVEFLGFNKVADNTFPNVIPMLTGLSKKQLEQSCWPSKNSVFDSCRFVWDHFREAGYTTAFAEDSPWNDGIFTFGKRGFRKQPTEYYTRPFFMQAEQEIGFNRRFKSKLCLGSRKAAQVLLSYAFKFAYTMKKVLSFIFVWGVSLTHDYLNLAQQGDVHYKEILEKLLSEGIFNRTALVFTSDHGMRYGLIRQTYQGYLEERLPFLFIAYPDWFRQKYTAADSNLKQNARKLTTPFDLHQTLLDLVNLTLLETEVLKRRSVELGNTRYLPRGISLFLPIPGNRTCKDADIKDNWCTCHQSVSVSTDDTLVKGGAKYMVDHINSLLEDYPDCARLELKGVTNARKEVAAPLKGFETSDGVKTDLTVTIETEPGNALFESTVRYQENTRNFTVVGMVSRINSYGNQSSCVSLARLQLYCYCV